MTDPKPTSPNASNTSWKTSVVDWLGAQGAGNLSIYVIAILTGTALVVDWLN